MDLALPDSETLAPLAYASECALLSDLTVTSPLVSMILLPSPPESPVADATAVAAASAPVLLTSDASVLAELRVSDCASALTVSEPAVWSRSSPLAAPIPSATEVERV